MADYTPEELKTLGMDTDDSQKESSSSFDDRISHMLTSVGMDTLKDIREDLLDTPLKYFDLMGMVKGQEYIQLPVGRGIIKAAESTINVLPSVDIELPKPPPPKDTGQQVIETLSQATASYIPAARVFRFLGGWKQAIAAGTVSEFLGFEADEANIADMVASFTDDETQKEELYQSTLGYLQTKDEDGEYEGRLKNALTNGLVVGVVAEVAFGAIKATKHWWTGTKPAKAIIEDQKTLQNQLKVYADDLEGVTDLQSREAILDTNIKGAVAKGDISLDELEEFVAFDKLYSSNLDDNSVVKTLAKDLIEARKRPVQSFLNKKGDIEEIEKLTNKERIVQNIADAYHPLVIWSRLARKHGADKAADSMDEAYINARLHNNASEVALRFLTEEAVNFNSAGSLARVAGPLKDVLVPVANQEKAFFRYASAVRIRDLNRKFIEEGVDRRVGVAATREEELDMANSIINAQDLQNPHFKDVAQDLQEWNKHLLEFARQNELLGDKEFEALANSLYTPLYRLATTEGGDIAIGGAKGRVAPVKKALRGIKGVEEIEPRSYEGILEDPMEAYFQNIVGTVYKSMENRAMNEMFRAIENGPANIKWIEKVTARPMHTTIRNITSAVNKQRKALGLDEVNPETMMELDESGDFLQFWTQQKYGEDVKGVLQRQDDGSVKYVAYRIKDKNLRKSVEALGKENTPIFENSIIKRGIVGAITAPARLTSAFITRTPTFLVKQYLRDMQTSFFLSESGQKVGINAIEAVYNRASKSKLWADYVRNGGSVAGMVSSKRVTNRNRLVREMYKEMNIDYNRDILDIFGVFKKYTGINAWDNVVSNMENLYRFNEFIRLKDQGYTSREAALGAREVVGDFSLHGSSDLGRAWTRSVAFLNAQIQSLRREGRAIVGDKIPGLNTGVSKKKRVVSAVSKILGTTVGVSVMEYIMNKDNPDWKALPSHVRDLHYIMYIGDKRMLMPVPYELAAPGKAVQEFLRQAERGDYGEAWSKATDKFIELVAASFRGDINSDGTLDILSSVIQYSPTAFKPVLEIGQNEDAFGLPIESQKMQGVRPQERYRVNTPEIYKEWSRAIDGEVSPIQIQHIINGITARMIDVISNDANNLLGIADPEMMFKDYSMTPHLKDVPVLGKFLQNTDDVMRQNYYTEQIYKEYKKSRMSKGSLDKLKDSLDSADLSYFTELLNDKEFMEEVAIHKPMYTYIQDMANLSKQNDRFKTLYKNDPEKLRDITDKLANIRNVKSKAVHESLIEGLKLSDKYEQEEHPMFASLSMLGALGATLATRGKYKPQFTSRIIEQLGKKSTVSVSEIKDLAKGKGVTAQEKNAIERVVEGFEVWIPDRKKIPTERFRQAFDEEILPLKSYETAQYSSYDVSNEIIPRNLITSTAGERELIKNPNSPTTRIYTNEQVGEVVSQSNHFSEPKYVAHVRSADIGDTRKIYELQSDLFQGEIQGQKGFRAYEDIAGLRQSEPEIELLLNEFAIKFGDEYPRLDEILTVFQKDKNIKVKDVNYLEKLISENSIIQKEMKFTEGYLTFIFDLKKAKEIPEVLADQQKQWYKRIVREEIKDAADKGLTHVDIPTGDTAARIEGWYGAGNRQFVVNNVMSDFDNLQNLSNMGVININDPSSYRNAYDQSYLGHSAEDAEHQILQMVDNVKSAIRRDIDINMTQGDMFNLVEKELPDTLEYQLRDQFKSLFNFYEKDLPKFIDKNYDMKKITEGGEEITEKLGKTLSEVSGVSAVEATKLKTSWWRITIPKHTGEIMIPAAGGVALLAGGGRNEPDT